MEATTTKFTLEHYEHMVAAGAFDEPYRKRVELIEGEIVDMTPVGPLHAYEIDRLARWSHSVTNSGEVLVRIQNPIRMPTAQSEPEPDIVWVRELGSIYVHRHPTPNEVLLLVEVADTSLGIDRGVKKRLYADAGIPEYWIVNLIDEQVEVFRDPTDGEFRSNDIAKAGAIIAPLCLPSAELKVADLFA